MEKSVGPYDGSVGPYDGSPSFFLIWENSLAQYF